MAGRNISLKIPLPYYKKKSKALFTMNTYRNAHQFQQAKFKLEYSNICLKALEEVGEFFFEKLRLEYTLFLPPTKDNKDKKIDLVNILSMVDKVFADSLTSGGYIVDDYIAYIQKVTFKYIQSIKGEGYIVVKIIEEI